MSEVNFMVLGIYNLFDNGLIRRLTEKYSFTEGQEALAIGLGLAFCIIFSYLIGSVNFALVVSRLFFHDDVRRHGSGNAGATNVLRSYGKKAGILTFAGDGLKGALCIVVACLIFGYPFSPIGWRDHILLVLAAYLSAFFCIFGHVFPCFAKFRGGKGFATMAVSVLCLNPFIFLILCAIFFPLVLMTKYVSLGSVVAAMFYPILLHTFDTMEKSHHYGVSTFVAVLIAALVIWAHRGNIKRIMNRTERKLGEHSTPAPEAEPVPEAAPTEADAEEDGEDETYTPAAHRSLPIKKKKHPVSEKKRKRQKKEKR